MSDIIETMAWAANDGTESLELRRLMMCEQNRLEILRKEFPNFTIRSMPDPECNCDRGVRTVQSGKRYPCMCVCLSAPAEGEKDWRKDAMSAMGRAARRELRKTWEDS